MKPLPEPSDATFRRFAAVGDEPSSGGGSDPIPPGTVMPIPGGDSFEQPGGGGRDDEQPKPTTSMPLKGR